MKFNEFRLTNAIGMLRAANVLLKFLQGSWKSGMTKSELNNVIYLIEEIDKKLVDKLDIEHK